MNPINLSRINWNNLSKEELDEIESQIQGELSEQERNQIDVRLHGQLVYFRAKKLSWIYKHEILAVMVKWLDDEDMLKNYEINDERVYDWAALKRQERYFKRTNPGENLRRYWGPILQKRRLKKGLNALFKRGAADQDFTGTQEGAVFEDFLQPFNPKGDDERETERQFSRIPEIHEVHRVPWKPLILCELGSSDEKKRFGDLSNYTNYYKLEKVVKLSTLLQLETEGTIELCQDKPFTDPTIEVIEPVEPVLTKKGRDGVSQRINVSSLTEEERLALIQQAKDGEVICV